MTTYLKNTTIVQLNNECRIVPHLRVAWNLSDLCETNIRNYCSKHNILCWACKMHIDKYKEELYKYETNAGPIIERLEHLIEKQELIIRRINDLSDKIDELEQKISVD